MSFITDRTKPVQDRTSDLCPPTAPALHAPRCVAAVHFWYICTAESILCESIHTNLLRVPRCAWLRCTCRLVSPGFKARFSVQAVAPILLRIFVHCLLFVLTSVVTLYEESDSAILANQKLVFIIHTHMYPKSRSGFSLRNTVVRVGTDLLRTYFSLDFY